MGQNDQQVFATVPGLHGIAGRQPARWRALLDGVAGPAAIALVIAGLVVTVGWGSFLVWCVFSLVRWAIG
jgi:hypothetical protein